MCLKIIVSAFFFPFSEALGCDIKTDWLILNLKIDTVVLRCILTMWIDAWGKTALLSAVAGWIMIIAEREPRLIGMKEPSALSHSAIYCISNRSKHKFQRCSICISFSLSLPPHIPPRYPHLYHIDLCRQSLLYTDISLMPPQLLSCFHNVTQDFCPCHSSSWHVCKPFPMWWIQPPLLLPELYGYL